MGARFTKKLTGAYLTLQAKGGPKKGSNSESCAFLHNIDNPKIVYLANSNFSRAGEGGMHFATLNAPLLYIILRNLFDIFMLHIFANTNSPNSPQIYMPIKRIGLQIRSR